MKTLKKLARKSISFPSLKKTLPYTILLPPAYSLLDSPFQERLINLLPFPTSLKPSHRIEEKKRWVQTMNDAALVSLLLVLHTHIPFSTFHF